jgi:hypothetical protein
MLILIDEQLEMMFSKKKLNKYISEFLIIFVKRTLRNSYLQPGDYDTEVLPHSSDLERRLRQYEYYPWVKSFPEPLRHYRCID